MVAASSRESYGILPALHAPTNATALHRDCRPQWRRQDDLRPRIPAEGRGLGPVRQCRPDRPGVVPARPTTGCACGRIRRFGRGWENFVKVYRPLANEWAVYDNSAKSPKLLERWP